VGVAGWGSAEEASGWVAEGSEAAKEAEAATAAAGLAAALAAVVSEEAGVAALEAHSRDWGVPG